MNNRNEECIYQGFFWNQSVKKTTELQKDFLRPVYQYTPSEIRNTQRESWQEKENESF